MLPARLWWLLIRETPNLNFPGASVGFVLWGRVLPPTQGEDGVGGEGKEPNPEDQGNSAAALFDLGCSGGKIRCSSSGQQGTRVTLACSGFALPCIKIRDSVIFHYFLPFGKG